MRKCRPIKINVDDPDQLRDVLNKCYAKVNGVKLTMGRDSFKEMGLTLKKRGVTHVVEVESTLEFVSQLDERHRKIFRVGAEVIANDIAITPEGETFRRVANFIDLILEPEDAEDLIANLDEGFQRRAAVEGGHGRRWLWAQVGWIMFGRALDVVRSVVRARAGK